MSQEIRNLEPKALWNKFADLNAVPRPSKKEDRVIEFMKNFGISLGLETFEDEIRNVIIRKPATPGMENRKPIVLQGHLDMVPQKNSATVHNFETDPIDAWIDGDWVKARGTTLGADNGIGVEEKHLPRLFERFYRVEKSRNRNEGGSGLGLAIVKHILESHGQSIAVRSKIGKGSTFSFSLDKSENSGPVSSRGIPLK